MFVLVLVSVLLEELLELETEEVLVELVGDDELEESASLELVGEDPEELDKSELESELDKSELELESELEDFFDFDFEDIETELEEEL